MSLVAAFLAFNAPVFAEHGDDHHGMSGGGQGQSSGDHGRNQGGDDEHGGSASGAVYHSQGDEHRSATGAVYSNEDHHKSTSDDVYGDSASGAVYHSQGDEHRSATGAVYSNDDHHKSASDDVYGDDHHRSASDDVYGDSASGAVYGKAHAEQAARALAAQVDALLAQGKLDEAQALVQQALAAAPDDRELLKRLAQVLRKAGDDDFHVVVNGATLVLKPVLKDGRTLVPLRGLAEALKAKVSWDAGTQTITVTRGDLTVQLQVGSTTALVNGQPATIDVPPQIVDGHTFVPLRLIAEALKAQVNFHGDLKFITVSNPSGTSANEATYGSTDANGGFLDANGNPAPDSGPVPAQP